MSCDSLELEDRPSDESKTTSGSNQPPTIVGKSFTNNTLENKIEALKEHYEKHITSLKTEIEEFSTEKKTHDQEVEDLQNKLLLAEERYDRFIEGIYLLFI